MVQETFQISMSGRGDRFDKAMVETFFKAPKSEPVWRMAFETRAAASMASRSHPPSFRARLHTSLARFEKMAVT